MNREQAKELYTDKFLGDELVTNIWVELEDIMDEVFDSLENQKCENCKYYIPREELNPNHAYAEGTCGVQGWVKATVRNFGCTRFEANAK